MLGQHGHSVGGQLGCGLSAENTNIYKPTLIGHTLKRMRIVSLLFSSRCRELVLGSSQSQRRWCWFCLSLPHPYSTSDGIFANRSGQNPGAGERPSVNLVTDASVAIGQSVSIGKERSFPEKTWLGDSSATISDQSPALTAGFCLQCYSVTVLHVLVLSICVDGSPT